MTTKAARHKRGQWRGNAPRAALVIILGHRIEAVQFPDVAPAWCLSVEHRKTENQDIESRDQIVAKLAVLLFVGASCAITTPNSPQFTPERAISPDG